MRPHISGLNLRDKVRAAVITGGVDPSSSMANLSDNMCRYLLCSKSEGTAKSYHYSYKKWQVFIRGHGFNDLPAQPVHVALYLTYLLDNSTSFNTVNSAVYAIKWAHELAGQNDPTENAFVKSLQESARRLTGKPVQRKDPASPEMLQKLCAMHEGSDDLLILRNLVMILISFAGFLRFDELSSLKCKDVLIYDDHLVLNISKSKNDQYRKGSEVLIAKGQSCACPYEMYLKYVSKANIDIRSDDFLFKPIFYTKKGSKLIYKNKKISYSTVRKHVVSLLSSVAPGLNVGVHSLRAGGATSAARFHVNERCLKRHGRWKSTSSKDMYIEDSVDERLSVSKMLGL